MSRGQEIIITVVTAMIDPHTHIILVVITTVTAAGICKFKAAAQRYTIDKTKAIPLIKVSTLAKETKETTVTGAGICLLQAATHTDTIIGRTKRNQGIK